MEKRKTSYLKIIGIIVIEIIIFFAILLLALRLALFNPKGDAILISLISVAALFLTISSSFTISYFANSEDVLKITLGWIVIIIVSNLPPLILAHFPIDPWYSSFEIMVFIIHLSEVIVCCVLIFLITLIDSCWSFILSYKANER